jgi:eukaryotic-like serine/threonine-protein kinase
MTPEPWQQIRGVLEEALELAPEQRSAFLQRNCSSDPSLRQEVETLLASSPDVRSSFLQSSPLRVTLTPRTKLGDYEVKSLLGSGGMGEVYRTRDSRLGRDVAIKVLPSLLSTDSERLRRFDHAAPGARERHTIIHLSGEDPCTTGYRIFAMPFACFARTWC